MLHIVVVFLASFIVIGSIAYIIWTYDSQTEEFGIPTRTETLLSSTTRCETEPKSDENEDEEDEDEVISMEDVLQMRNHKGETVQQKVVQKASGMGFREGPAGPTEETSQASKPET